MKQAFTNNHKVSLALAVWLVDDTYDYNPDENYISVTGLMKPLRHIILPSRAKPQDIETPDVTDMVARAMGTALHDSVEKAWKERYKENLTKLGYPPKVIERIKINPSAAELTPNTIPIYIEQRNVREINGWRVGGKFDMVTNGVLQDNKSTSVFAYMQDNKDGDYILQGSLYRWLNPDKITEDFIRINFIFTDWQRREALAKPDVYPQHKVMHKEYPLWSIKETEQWVINRLELISKHFHTPEPELPFCTREELWQSEDIYKYYADPEKAKLGGRSTRTFTDKVEAHKFVASKAGGILITVPGKPKRCDYCPAFNVCSQKDRYQDD